MVFYFDWVYYLSSIRGKVATRGGDMDKQRSTIVKVASVLLILCAAAALFVAESAYWVNHTIFDQKNFSTIVTQQLTTSESRKAIATTVVNRALEDRPVAQRLFGERAIALVSGLLDSDASRQAITALSTKTYAYVTASKSSGHHYRFIEYKINPR